MSDRHSSRSSSRSSSTSDDDLSVDEMADKAASVAGSSLETLVDLLEDRYTIPGTNFRFGLDAILGLIPGIGDFIGAFLGGAIVVEGWRRGVGGVVIARMLLNLWLDAALGSLPVIGDIFDLFFKANRRNLELLQEHSSR